MLSNLVIFSRKSIASEEFFNQMVDALGITIMDRRPKGKPVKMEIKP